MEDGRLVLRLECGDGRLIKERIVVISDGELADRVEQRILGAVHHMGLFVEVDEPIRPRRRPPISFP